MIASIKAVAQTTIAATDAESNPRSFLEFLRDTSHQPRMFQCSP